MIHPFTSQVISTISLPSYILFRISVDKEWFIVYFVTVFKLILARHLILSLSNYPCLKFKFHQLLIIFKLQLLIIFKLHRLLIIFFIECRGLLWFEWICDFHDDDLLLIQINFIISYAGYKYFSFIFSFLFFYFFFSFYFYIVVSFSVYNFLYFLSNNLIIYNFH